MRQTIPIYLLTTKKTKRKKRIIQRLKKLKLNYKIIYGLDAKNVKDQKLLIKNYNKSEAIKNANRELSFYDIACADGHLKIYKEIVKNKIKSAIIIEDDCFLSKKICFDLFKYFFIGFLKILWVRALLHFGMRM